MKKSLLIVMLILGFALQEPVYDKVDEFVRCVEYSDVYKGMYTERVYFVKEGMLVKLVEYEYIPFSYYESLGLDIEDAFFELMDDYVYRGYPHVGYTSLAPYYDSNGILNPYLVIDFNDLSLFSVEEVSNSVKSGNRKQVIFESYYEMYEKSDNCSLK